MALEKIIENSTGTTSSYWRVVVVSTNYEASQTNILLYGYKDETARNQNKSPLDQKSFSVLGSEFSTWFGTTELDALNVNHIKNSYLYIKQIPNGEFNGATDK